MEGLNEGLFQALCLNQLNQNIFSWFLNLGIHCIYRSLYNYPCQLIFCGCFPKLFPSRADFVQMSRAKINADDKNSDGDVS